MTWAENFYQRELSLFPQTFFFSEFIEPQIRLALSQFWEMRFFENGTKCFRQAPVSPRARPRHAEEIQHEARIDFKSIDRYQEKNCLRLILKGDIFSRILKKPENKDLKQKLNCNISTYRPGWQKCSIRVVAMR